METTDRLTVRAKVADRRTDEAIAVEVQEERVVEARRCRPIVAAATDIVETATAVVAITRSRIPNYGGIAELAGEVHAFVSAIVWIVSNV